MLRLPKRYWMSEGRRTQIVLIEDRQLDIVVQPRLSVDELLSIVASHCHLKDPDKQYFGLAFLDDKQNYHWLQNERRVLDHEFPRKFTISGATLVLYHLIKLFVDSIINLVHPSSVELFFLHASTRVHRGLIEADSDSVFQLGAYLVQAYYGDFNNENIARNNLKRLPLFPAKTLKEYSSVSSCEDKVLEIYKTLVGLSKGAAIVNYMTLVEKLYTYGVHFYEIKDKAGTSFTLGISSRGIYQYDTNDRTKPLRGFQWKQLENLYYRDKKFSVEVHETKRVVHTLSSFNLYEDAMREPLDVSDDLTAAVCDPTTQVSVSRRAFVPSNIHVHVYFCESPQLCKTIWSLTIAQHQFYLDKRSNKQNVNTVAYNPKELADKLSESLTMVTTNGHNHLSSLNARTNADNSSTSDLGSSISSQSLQSMPSSNSVERNEEDRTRDAEYCRQLKTKKARYEQLLAEKLKELKEVCIKEGSITGELPQEIKRTLAPGEAEPKIQRRVGTAFSISLDIMSKQTKADQIAKLEADVEIQRKIVTAALKLANDVTANKMVRRKRRRDYQCAQLRLRELEQHLHQLRLSSSKPDLPNVHLDKFVSNGSLTKNVDAAMRITKSAPNTPRGSVSDLTDFTVSMSTNVGETSKSSIIAHKPPISHRPPNLPIGPRFNFPAHLQERTLHHSSSFGSDPRVLLSSSVPSSPPCLSSLSNNSSGQNSAAPPLPPCDPSIVYKNEPAGGYRSHSAYQSSYRMQHYPTLNSSNGQLASSSGDLNSENSSMQSLVSSDYDTLPPFQRYRKHSPSTAIDHQIGAYNIPNQRTSWDYECLNQMNSAAILGSSESLDAVSVAAAPPHLFTPRYAPVTGQVLRLARPVGVTSHCYTGSLDRRVLKQRQKEKWKRMGMSSTSNENDRSPSRSKSPTPPPPPLIDPIKLDRSPTRYGNYHSGGDGNKRSASVSCSSYVPCQRPSSNSVSSFNEACDHKLSAGELLNDYHHQTRNQLPLYRKMSEDSTTTSRSSSMSTIAGGYGSSVEMTKPFETSDALKYSERSRYSPTVSSSSSPATRSPNHGIRRGESLGFVYQTPNAPGVQIQRPPSRLQRQNMAAVDLLAWYDDQDTTKGKPATIV